jgi:acyl carrier protein
MSPESIRAAAREIVSDIAAGKVADDETLISSGRIDSLSILKLISRLEEKLSIHMPIDALQPEDFDTIDLIVETVERVGTPR